LGHPVYTLTGLFIQEVHMHDIGNRLEPFVDEWLIDKMQGASLRLYPPERREVVLEMNAPAEGPTSCYFNLFEEGGRIRLYYRGHSPGDASPLQTVNYAESTDGIHFSRPVLNQVEYQGSRRNHITYQGIEGHNFHVFRDDHPACKSDERYKAVGAEWEKLYGFVSPDGWQWRRLRDEPLDVKGTFDSLNVVFWDSRLGAYRLFSRYFDNGIRAIQSCTSEDFIHWSTPIHHDYGTGAELEHYYTNATLPCPGAEHILLSFPKRFIPERTRITPQPGYEYTADGVSDAVFLSSRDGIHWRRFSEAWVRPGLDQENWTHRSNMVAWGIVRSSPIEWSMYISEHYGWITNRLRRLAIRPWGFSGIHADRTGGELVTHPLRFSGGALHLNASTSAAGSIQVEIQTAEGRPLEGFALSDMNPWFGDELDAVMTWRGGTDLSRVAGHAVRLRMVFKDADMFALRFS
jgi:hypothetical protein